MAKKYFNLKLPKRPWLRGGVIGSTICVLLFLFYIFVYFPVIDDRYPGNPPVEIIPVLLTTIPFTTGHSFPLFSHFFVEGTGLVGILCKPTVPSCYSWSAKEFAHGGCTVSWTVEGVEGCCLGVTMSPTAACDRNVELFGFLGLSVLLIILYFLIGASIGWFFGRKKK